MADNTAHHTAGRGKWPLLCILILICLAFFATGYVRTGQALKAAKSSADAVSVEASPSSKGEVAPQAE